MPEPKSAVYFRFVEIKREKNFCISIDQSNIIARIKQNGREEISR